MKTLWFLLSFRAIRTATITLWVKRSPIVPDYYDYVTSLVLGLATSDSAPLQYALGYPEDARYVPARIPLLLIQIEHTIVRSGGRGSEGAVPGGLLDEKTAKPFLVRLQGSKESFYRAHTVIEYSKPNLRNVLDSSISQTYESKAVYIAPMLGTPMTNPSWQGRDFSRVYTAMNLSGYQDRRSEILSSLMTKDSINLRNLSGIRDLTKRYPQVGLLLNLHQTEHHVTLEELRILPALRQGVIVISEPSPLLEIVPYSSFLIFANLDEISHAMKRVLDQPARTWHSIFGGSRFANTMGAMEKDNRRSLSERLASPEIGHALEN